MADLAATSAYSSRERAFLGICADLVGQHVDDYSFVERFANIEGKHQKAVVDVLARIDDDNIAHENEARGFFT